MKRLLLTCLFSTTILAAQAQFAQIVGLGVAAGVNATRQQGNYVTKVTYRGQVISQKRTPPGKLPKKGGPEIAQLEAMLQQCYSTLLADDVTPLVPTDRYQAFTSARQQLQAMRSPWDVSAYEEEMSFYRVEDNNRRYRREAQAWQLREQQRADSLTAVARRQQAIVDSSTAVAQAKRMQAVADSTEQAARVGLSPSVAPAHAATAALKAPAKKTAVKAKGPTGPQRVLLRQR